MRPLWKMFPLACVLVLAVSFLTATAIGEPVAGYYEGQVEGDAGSGSVVGMNVAVNADKNPKALKDFYFYVRGDCSAFEDAENPVEGTIDRIRVKKQDGKFKFSFHGTTDTPSDITATVAGTVKKRKRRVVGTISASQPVEGLGECSFEKLPFSAGRV
jgi:hypothetical protein